MIKDLKEIYETKDIYQEEQTSNKLLEEFLIRRHKNKNRIAASIQTYLKHTQDIGRTDNA